jgi:hypothetical protein
MEKHDCGALCSYVFLLTKSDVLLVTDIIENGSLEEDGTYQVSSHDDNGLIDWKILKNTKHFDGS